MVFTGHSYLYKGVANTYLKGRTGPNIDEFRIFYNRMVEAGEHHPWPVSSSYNSKEIPEQYEADFLQYKTIAYLIIKNDSLVFEKYWDEYSEDSYTNSFSMAKTIVSILTGIAIREEKIKSIDQPVCDFLPEYCDEPNQKLSIKHLLTMSSGIGFDEDYAGAFNFPAKAYYGSDLEKLVRHYQMTEEPGKTFDYQSGTTQLLGFVLEKATGTTLSEYASEKLWKPLGAKNPAFWSLDREDGHEKAYCCFNSNARDFARLGQLYLDSGRWKGQQIVPEEFALNSVKIANLLEKNGEPTTRYGYSWWLLKHKGHKVFYARGILGQYVFVLPEKNLVVVRLGHKRAQNAKANPPDDVLMWLDAALNITGEN